MKNHHMTTSIRLSTLAALLIANTAYAADINISEVPLDVALNTANTVLVLDDSASMDYELMLGQFGNTFSDGVLYWDSGSNKRYTRSSGKKSGFLFPTGRSAEIGNYYVGDGRANGDPNGERVVPPLPAYMYLRSADYNPMYYDPRKTYSPWPAAYVKNDAGTFDDRTFANSPPAAARTHPYFSGNGQTSITPSSAGTPTTFDLTRSQFTSTDCSVLNNAAPEAFYGYNGMPIPATRMVVGAQSNVVSISPDGSTTRYPLCFKDGTTWKPLALASNVTALDKDYASLAIPYTPAEFWSRRATAGTCAWPSCATDPDGNQYDRVNLLRLDASAASFTLPSGTVINRSKAQELQNFANWFTYYRNRKLLMASSMGLALDDLQQNYRQLKAAAILMHNVPKAFSGSNQFSATNPKFFDLTSTTTSNNARALIGTLYTMAVAGGTPTYEGLEGAGKTYRNDVGGPIPTTNAAESALRCSANSAFVLTDGYARDVSDSNRLYYLSKGFYDNMRSWTPTGGQRTLNTYGITLGALGTLFHPTATAPDPVSGAWPTPVAGDATSIDDLWRATLYSKGKLLSASDTATLQESIADIINSMYSTGAQAALGYSSPIVSSDNNVVIQASYESGGWTGNLNAYSTYMTGANIGKVNYADSKWVAGDLLTSRSAGSRKIVTFAGGQKVPFTAAALTDAGILGTLNTSGQSDGEDVLNFLRGDRSKEGSTYRKRASLLGDIVNSNPTYVHKAASPQYNYPGYSAFATSVQSRTPVVYVGANDGMLHAFNATNGNELWAYVPSMVHANLNRLSTKNYSHKFYVDGQLTSWDVNFGTDAAPDWRTVLIGGLRGGGQGYFAIDITSAPAADASESDIASKLLWEFKPANMGLSFGKPIIGLTKAYGWVALLPSGYNNADGKGHLYVVQISTGTLLKDLEVGTGNPQVGLGAVQGVIDWEVSATSTNNATLKYAYGGDLNGNLWRFDISDADKDNWSAKRLAANLGRGGVAAPITAAPDVALIRTPGPFPANQNSKDVQLQRLMVFVGNGKLLHSNDFQTTNNNIADNGNGFWAIHDANDSMVLGETSPCSPITNCLMQVGLGQGAQSAGLNNWTPQTNSSLNRWWIIGGPQSEGPFNWQGESRSKRGWYYLFSETGGERVIAPPVVFGGSVSFATTMKSDTRHTPGAGISCEPAFSAIYGVKADRGGATPGFPARTNAGFGILSSLSLIRVGDDVYATGGKKNSPAYTDESCPPGTPACSVAEKTDEDDITVNGGLRRFGWREVYR